jgi:transcriptional/translational regulatory protein YebC/TACO1
MAGHSKWANIKHRKEAQDKKRSKVWTKLIREITVAAREGGGDAGANPRLRLASEVRHAFTKHGGNLGTDGSVGYLFTKRGVLSFAPGADEDRIMEAALEAGADDVVTYEDGSVDVLTAPDAFEAVRAAMTAAGLAPGDAEVTFHPSTAAPVEGDAAEKLLKMLDVLEDLDDVQNVYSNADIDEAAIAAVGG